MDKQQHMTDYIAYIYLIQEGKHIGSHTYKIGRCKQKGDARQIRRLYNYSYGTIIHNIWKVDALDVKNIEKQIINTFNEKYNLHNGREWFSGDVYSMKNDIDKIISGWQPCSEVVNMPRIQIHYNDFHFDVSHVRSNQMHVIWDVPRHKEAFYKYASVVLYHPNNNIINKKDFRSSCCCVRIGSNWKTMQDKDVFPHFTISLADLALKWCNDNKDSIILKKTSLPKIVSYLNSVYNRNEIEYCDAIQRIRLLVVNLTKRWEEEPQPA